MRERFKQTNKQTRLFLLWECLNDKLHISVPEIGPFDAITRIQECCVAETLLSVNLIVHLLGSLQWEALHRNSVKGQCVEGMPACCTFPLTGRNYALLCVLNDLLNQVQKMRILGICLEVVCTQVTKVLLQSYMHTVLVRLNWLTGVNLL